MALKDLTIDKSKATEEIIESIIKPYIRYDVNSKSIFFLPKSTELNNAKQILIYLVALKGWKFVTKESISWEISPSKLEEITGIKGGTLRPTLKNLKDTKMIVVNKGEYSIPDYNIIKVKNISEGEIIPSKKPIKKEKQRKPETKTAVSGSSIQQFEDLINKEWFNSKRALTEIKEKFHELGRIVPSTSFPFYLLKLIRDGRLKRRKEKIKGKTVWVYFKK